MRSPDNRRCSASRYALAGWLLLLAFSFPVLANVSISPAYVDVELEGRSTGRFKVTNLGDQPERFRLNVRHFNFSEDGKLQDNVSDEHSLAEWVTFNPREFEIPAKTQRVVRFVVVPDPTAPDGEYWAGIELEALKTSSTRIDNGEGASMNINVLSAILVPVFGKIGNIENDGDIVGASIVQDKGGPQIEAVIRNQGQGRLVVTGEYTILDGDGQVLAAGPVGSGYVLRESSRAFRAAIDTEIAEGDYTLRLKFISPQLDHDLERQIRAAWEPANTPVE